MTTRLPAVVTALAGVLLAACGSGDDAERRARLGLPAPGHAPDAQRGATLYASHCQQCHGPGARGSDKGPPLLHGYYTPGHHADLAFYSAVRNGVVQHHWDFGDMPAQPQVRPEQVADITAHVRDLQRRHGLH